ncbi:MAG TPA: efflux RND transporter periplasmic adaptor subunit [Opitutaceae bacterium]|nr:efflux RND transporter periplasmic adaptor subunit [Opitutaceae bacterium]
MKHLRLFLLLLFASLGVLLLAADDAGRVFQCPMHPWIKSDHPGKCTICGMDLVSAAASPSETPSGVVALGPSSISVVGVETSTVARQPLMRTFRVNGEIDDDDTRHHILSARVPGRIEHLGVTYQGQPVAAGAELATIYSPEMLAAQRVYLERLKAGAPAYSTAELSAAREQLQMLGLNADDLAQLEQKREPSALVVVRAPEAGTVVLKHVYQGQYVQTSDRLFEIADFSSMWFVFDVYEQDIPWVQPGQTVEITTRAVPGETITAPIAFVDPNFNDTTRTTKARAVLPNPHFGGGGAEHTLPHRVLAEGRVLVESPAVLAAPRSAILDAGAGPVAYVDLGHDRYEQRHLRLGRRGDALVEVLDGLKENENVVTSGALFLDAQAQLAREAQTSAPGAAAPSPQSPARTEPGASPASDSPLAQLANVATDAAAALGSDDFARYQKIFPTLASAAQNFPALPKLELGSDLKTARRSFEPWSTAVADLLKPHRAQLGVKVFQCPMSPVLHTGRWVQRSQPLKNPFFGSAMPDCGEEVP